MGQTFSEPVTEKESSTEKNDVFLVSSSSIQGWRISMEDAHTILLQMPDDPSAAFFAVFDGHGGAKVANYAAENLYKGICRNHLYENGQIEEALKTVFVEFDEMMFNDEKMRDELAGSTAVSVLVKDSLIYCANIGDSRAVASFAGHVDALSLDHKPTCPDEMSRIVSAGGWVQFNRVNGNLALSRAFGDFVFKRNEKRSATEQIVIAYPDVQTRQLTDDLEFIILACDGVWDVMTNEEVIEFCRRRLIYRMEPVAICEELITRCLAPDCQMGSGIGCDNMTVILICYLNGATFEEFCDRVAEANTMGIPPPPPSMDQSSESAQRYYLGHRDSASPDGASGPELTPNSCDDLDSDTSETSSACSFDEMFHTVAVNNTPAVNNTTNEGTSSDNAKTKSASVTSSAKATDDIVDGYYGHSHSHHLHSYSQTCGQAACCSSAASLASGGAKPKTTAAVASVSCDHSKGE